jgi:AcrR family transcriptional regulator
MNHNSTTPLPVTLRGQRTRQRLLDAAEAVFGEKGYEAASIADLTRAAGVALGTFYVYFPDKKALFVEVVDALGDRLRHELAAATEGKADRLELERAGLLAFFAFARRHRLLYRVVRQAEFVDEACFRRYYRRIGEPYARRLSAAMDAGELRRVDPEALAYCLMGLTDFLGMRYVLWGGGRGLDRAVDTAIELVARGVHARPAAPAAPGSGHPPPRAGSVSGPSRARKARGNR